MGCKYGGIETIDTRAGAALKLVVRHFQGKGTLKTRGVWGHAPQKILKICTF